MKLHLVKNHQDGSIAVWASLDDVREKDLATSHESFIVAFGPTRTDAMLNAALELNKQAASLLEGVVAGLA
jgi:hypothetical protein